MGHGRVGNETRGIFKNILSLELQPFTHFCFPHRYVREIIEFEPNQPLISTIDFNIQSR